MLPARYFDLQAVLVAEDAAGRGAQSERQFFGEFEEPAEFGARVGADLEADGARGYCAAGDASLQAVSGQKIFDLIRLKVKLAAHACLPWRANYRLIPTSVGDGLTDQRRLWHRSTFSLMHSATFSDDGRHFGMSRVKSAASTFHRRVNRHHSLGAGCLQERDLCWLIIQDFHPPGDIANGDGCGVIFLQGTAQMIAGDGLQRAVVTKQRSDLVISDTNHLADDSSVIRHIAVRTGL
jgi:hypothetical protein